MRPASSGSSPATPCRPAPAGRACVASTRSTPLSAGGAGELDRELEAATGGAQGAALLRMAAEDPHVRELVRESSVLPSEPLLSLWYRPSS